MAKGIDNQDTFDRIRSDLTQAHQLAKRLTRLDFICWAAEDLGELLASSGARDVARPLFTEAREGYLKLGQTQRVAHINALLAQLDAPPAPEG